MMMMMLMMMMLMMMLLMLMMTRRMQARFLAVGCRGLRMQERQLLRRCASQTDLAAGAPRSFSHSPSLP
eukprot:10207910-Karenia_brevis.AAC.1